MEVFTEIRNGCEATAGLAKGIKGMFNPEIALGISENIGGRVKRVKKVKCYNVDPGEP